jgi:hypothetical protein
MLKANTQALFLLMMILLIAACSPQAADEGELPTLAVLPTGEPTAEPTLVPPTALPTETVPATNTPEVLPPTEAPPVVAANPGDGNLLPGCDTWQNWDASRLEMRDRIYAQPPAGDPAVTALTQVQQLRAEVALLDYDECLTAARSAYLSALDAAASALSAPDRATAEGFETTAAQALAEFDNAIRVLENS